MAVHSLGHPGTKKHGHGDEAKKLGVNRDCLGLRAENAAMGASVIALTLSCRLEPPPTVRGDTGRKAKHAARPN